MHQNRLLLGCALAAALACVDSHAPTGGRVSISVVPVFQNAAALVSSADQLRIRVIKIEDETVVADTTVDIDPATGEASATLAVRLDRSPQEFLVRLDAMRSSDGTILFSGTATVTVSVGSDAADEPVEIPVQYAGPSASYMLITPRDTVVEPGGSFQFDAVAYDAAENSIDVPVSFDLANPADSVILRVDRATGDATAADDAQGVVRVVASTFDTPALRDTAYVFVSGVLQNSVVDPTGDTFETSASAGLAVPDITALSGEVQSGNLIIQISFAQQVVAPTPAGDEPNAFIGLIDIDTDQNPLTGGQANTDGFRPDTGSTGMGIEYAVTLFSVDSLGRVMLSDYSGETLEYVPAVWGGNTITVVIPMSFLGNDDGNLNLATVIGNQPEPTDIAPNNGHLTVGTTASLLSAARGATSHAGAAPVERARVLWGKRR